ncbi:MAG: WG repeat-containing protein [Flavobacteriaceae bacterium]|nr:WG repeat-containing protein [Flavobacteriaceae bacterium]
MKKSVLILLAFSFLSATTLAQNLKDLDYVAPFHEEMAAVKKDGQWSFITSDGDLAFSFRNDLVATSFGTTAYPVFNDGRCLVKLIKQGIAYFGYIDKQGKTVIEPQFLNASNFKDGKAIVLKLDKEKIGDDGNVLGQNLVDYSYVNVIINDKGDYVKYLSDWKKVTLSDKVIKKPPMITTKILSDDLFAVLEDKKWTIKKFN